VKRFAIRTVFVFSLVFAVAMAFSGSASAQYGYYDDYYDRGGAQQAQAYVPPVLGWRCFRSETPVTFPRLIDTE